MTAGAAPAATTADAGLLHALDAVARAYQVARYSGPGNPMGAQVLQRGRLVATKVPFVPGSPLMNRATGLESVADLVDVAAFFAATGQRGWIETTPCTPQAVTDALVAARFRIVHCGATLYAEPLPEPPPATAGATRITGQAEWGSSSQANMQRAGLQIAHLRTLWAGCP